jgi:hypothetical protein
MELVRARQRHEPAREAGPMELLRARQRPNPKRCWPTLRIWISSEPSVMR